MSSSVIYYANKGTKYFKNNDKKETKKKKKSH